MTAGPTPDLAEHAHGGIVNGIVRAFLHSNLSIVLMILAAALGITALTITPREEDPQIVVPLADIHVSFPGHSAAEVEQLVTSPLEELLYQIDGVEYVYSMSFEDHALITVRFYVGEDRERSLVKLYKRIDENLDRVPQGVTGWVIKPVEIDDVPIVTLTLASPTADSYTIRRVAEEVVERLGEVPNLSRNFIIGGQPRTMHVYLAPERMRAFSITPLRVRQAIVAGNVNRTAGDFSFNDNHVQVEAGQVIRSRADLQNLVISVSQQQPIFLKDVATIVDGPAEVTSYVRHGWGPARGFDHHPGQPGTLIGPPAAGEASANNGKSTQATGGTRNAVTIALAKKKGTNAVWVADDILAAAEKLKAEIVPDDMELIVTRNAGLTANEKVNELIEALAVAVFIVIALLTLGLGWREALIVAVAVPVVFGLTLAINLMLGFTINRVTLFALILSLGLLVDDPIVDVENISRHFHMRGKATRDIVLEAVSEIRPPLITATLAVIVSFLPMFFITGMMGPYMGPMALNVPITMLMSMLVAFTITPWLAYHMLKHRAGSKHENHSAAAGDESAPATASGETSEEDAELEELRKSLLYRAFYPLMAPLLRSRKLAWGFMLAMVVLTGLAATLAAARAVPLKMLPFDNKNELLFVLDFPEGTTLERADACVRDFEQRLLDPAFAPEVTDITSYVGVASPMDFNGLVRHYYLRQGPTVAGIRVNFVGKKSRSLQSHAIGLRMRDQLTELATRHDAKLSIVETPPGPPVIASLVAEVYGQPEHSYADLMDAARVVEARMQIEPGVVDVDTTIEASQTKLVFHPDQEKSALHDVSIAQIAETLSICLAGQSPGLVQNERERRPHPIYMRLARPLRSSPVDLANMHVAGRGGHLVPLAELGEWRETRVDQTIYHKNLKPVVYVFGESAGRPPADAVVDIEADRLTIAPKHWQGAYSEHAAPGSKAKTVGNGFVIDQPPVPLAGRTFLSNGSDVPWAVPPGMQVRFAGEGEWKITLDVFRDLGLAFAAALVGIYILLVAQTGSFIMPMVVMLAIPLTALGIMPGFWLLNLVAGANVGGYADPVFFTATGMIGMIALSGIVTRDAIILVDFIHLSLKRGRSLFDAIMESRVVRLRPILLTALTAMLSAAPITIDPIFSGLAWALIFGLFASTVFTLFVIPVAYWLLYAHVPGHGVPELADT